MTKRFDTTGRITPEGASVAKKQSKTLGPKDSAPQTTVKRKSLPAQSPRSGKASSKGVTKKELQASERHWKLLFDNSPIPVMVYDEETSRIWTVNKAMVARYGYTLEEFRGMEVSALYEEKYRNKLPLPGLSGKRGRPEVVKHLQKGGGEIYIELSSSPTEFAGRPARLVHGVDVTEKKELENRFLRAQRLECLGLLASGIAHDLNNVLAPILMSASMLHEPLPEETRTEFLTAIEHSAQRGAKLVRQVLAFVKGTDGEKMSLSPETIINEVLEMARQTFPKSIRIQSRIASDLWPIYGESTKLYQVFLNLTLNARDAMEGQGLLDVEVKNCELASEALSSNPSAKPGRFVAFSIRDTGTGIPPEVIQQIFVPFFSTKGEGKGTGLGLSTVLGIVQNHGGVIEVASKVGEGTVFTVYLPAMVSSEPEPVIEECRATGSGQRILVVDDEQGMLKMVKMLLTQNGYDVVVAGNATEALERYQAEGDQFDLVIVDLIMPGTDGVALSKAIRKINKTARILVSSGFKSEQRLKKLQSMGVTQFLKKPYSPKELLHAVSSALE